MPRRLCCSSRVRRAASVNAAAPAREPIVIPDIAPGSKVGFTTCGIASLGVKPPPPPVLPPPVSPPPPPPPPVSPPPSSVGVPSSNIDLSLPPTPEP